MYGNSQLGTHLLTEDSFRKEKSLSILEEAKKFS